MAGAASAVEHVGVTRETLPARTTGEYKRMVAAALHAFDGKLMSKNYDPDQLRAQYNRYFGGRAYGSLKSQHFQTTTEEGDITERVKGQIRGLVANDSLIVRISVCGNEPGNCCCCADEEEPRFLAFVLEGEKIVARVIQFDIHSNDHCEFTSASEPEIIDTISLREVLCGKGGLIHDLIGVFDSKTILKSID